MKREAWVDYIKVVACILVVLGHFFQSMVKARLLPTDDLFNWFNTTIYYFHVPLFFICSGYLYQKYSIVNSWNSWKQNVLKKALNLGIPFVVFSSLTWILKTVFPAQTNNDIGSLTEILFLHPYPPYWYLYVLFFLFLLTPTAGTNDSMGSFLAVACIMKFLICIFPKLSIWKIYAISGVFSYEIWFVLGMGLAVIGSEKIKKRLLGTFLLLTFTGLSIYTFRIINSFVEWGMAFLACVAIFMLMVLMPENKAFDRIAPYTMPVFLMHTLFAAPVRILLLKIGVGNALIQISAGITASFIGSIIAINIMEKIKLDILVYPGRYIEIKT